MINAIDTKVLDEQIDSLTKLRNSWENKAFDMLDTSSLGGKTVNELEDIKKKMSDIQDSFILLMDKTISYMRERKKSVDTKDAKTAGQIKSMS